MGKRLARLLYYQDGIAVAGECHHVARALQLAVGLQVAVVDLEVRRVPASPEIPGALAVKLDLSTYSY